MAWHDYLEMQKCGPWYCFKWQHLDKFTNLLSCIAALSGVERMERGLAGCVIENEK